MRQLQPNLVINDRAGIPSDYDAPERDIGTFQNNRRMRYPKPARKPWNRRARRRGAQFWVQWHDGEFQSNVRR
ncbi:MAG: hypothetical protein ABSH32_07355 [Bryobacteraceae bacterium]|jgi:hypothetical protein